MVFGAFQFQLRTMLAVTTVLAIYASLVPVYGPGRAVVCLLTLGLGCSSAIFYTAAVSALQDEQLRPAMATALLGTMILTGAMLIGLIVFVPQAVSVFDFR